MQKSKKIENLYWILSVCIAEFLSEFKLNLANNVPRRLLEQTLLFRIIKLLHEYGNELIYLRGNWFKIPGLDYVLSMRAQELNSFRFYLQEKKRMDFFNRDGRIYAKAHDFIFLLPFPYGIYELAEVFYDNCYACFDVSNGTVVDVGAFIGDTSVFFASKGAKKVIAYEPLPRLYKIATENISINKFDHVVRIYNEAISDRYGETVIHETAWPGTSSSFFLPGKEIVKSHKVEVTPLSDVILNSGEVDLLKIDCEGCEHAALKDAYQKKALKNIRHIIVEVHSNSCYILKLLQRAYFNIEKVVESFPGESMPVLVYASKKTLRHST